MTFAAVGSAVDVTTTTPSITPSSTSDFLLMTIVSESATVYASSASASNITWSVLVTHALAGGSNNWYVTTFIGQPTSTSAATTTISFTGGSAGTIRGNVKEFSTTAGFSSVTLDTSAIINTAGAATYPSLTPTQGAGELYYAFAYWGSSCTAGSTSGFVYSVDANGNGACWDVSCANAATQPTWGASMSTSAGRAILLYEASGGTVSGTGGLKIPKPAMSGSGTVEVEGSGGLAVVKPRLAGSGWVEVEGSGGLVVPKPAMSGAGTSTASVTGTGGLKVPKPALAGTGTSAVPVTGTGGLRVAKPALAGHGSGGVAPSVVNQWSATVAQNPALGPSQPINPSCVVKLAPGMKVGAFLDPGSMGVSTFTAALAQWTGFGMPAPQAARYYLANSTFTYDTNMQEMVAAGIKICLTVRPAFNPVSSTDLANLTTLLQTLQTAGAECDICLWHEPYYEGLTITQYNAVVQYYGPTVRQFYPLVFCTSVQSVENDGENAYYPGDAWVDKCATDFYAYDYVTSGYTLALAAQPANQANPPKPFGLWEVGSSTDPIVGQTQAQATSYFGYIQSYMQARLAANLVNADILFFNAGEHNLLTGQNAGFEGGVGSWIAYGGAVTDSSVQAHSGVDSAKMTASGTANLGIGYTAGGAAGIPVTNGSAYTVAAWFLAGSAGRSCQAGVNWYASGGGYLSSQFPGSTADSTLAWAQNAETVTAPANGYASPALQAESPAGSGEFHYTDDAIFAQQSNDSSVVGFGFGSSPSNDYRVGLWTSMFAALNGFTTAQSYTTGLGSGTPSPGSWLFVLAGWNQGPAPATLASVADDTHGWWRPASPSSSAGVTRTVGWYLPNIGAGQTLDVVPTQVYVAPGDYMDGIAVTVLEVAGLGPWDTVEGINTNHAAAATSLALALGAPSASSFLIGAVTGDNTAAATAFAPASWTALQTVTAANGTDHTGDTVLASAYLAATTGSVSVAGSAGTAENLSGFLISVLDTAPSPVPGGQNPNWPYLVFEAAFGSGYLTPPDQMVWTDLLPDASGIARLRSWNDATGTQYELDSIETSETTLLLDNPDAALSSDNTTSPYFPDVLPGTPVRLRAIPPASTSDFHWYVHQRYAERWPQSWDSLLRGQVEFTGNDPWQSVSKQVPTPYRAEVIADNPYAWWPCDDPAIIPLPTSLVNAAPGNSNPLQIATSINGLSASVTGQPFTTSYYYSAVQNFAAATQWMYGDPDAAAWQQTGAAGTVATGGAFGRYLACGDPNFPSIANGITVEAWVNLDYYASGSGTTQGPYQQANNELVLWSLSSPGLNAIHPGTISAQLLVSASDGVSGGGDLVLVTYNAGTPTVHVVYSASDLRNNTWLGITVTLTGSTWAVWMNGTLLASGSATISVVTGWEFFALGCELWPVEIVGVCNASIAHVAIYPLVLPQARIMAHYVAAYTGFGQLPAPSISGQYIQTGGANTYAPNGSQHPGAFFVTPGYTGHYSLAAVAVAVLGAYTSYPSSPESITSVQPGSSEQTGFMWLTAAVPAAPSLSWYTSEGAGNELLGSGPSVQGYAYVNSFGTGAVPPTASALGDTVQQRIERLLAAGLVPGLPRAIDPAGSPVVAALDIGGQACGANISNITASDGGLLFEDAQSVLCYRDKTWLAAAPTMWVLGPNTAIGQIPYEGDVKFDTDPQRVINDIQITQYNVAPNAVSANTSGTGESQTIPGVTYSPAASYYAAILASQQQYGPKQVQNGSTSYLQAGASIQNQANWLFDQLGQPVTRITSLTIEAGSKTRTAPQAWTFYWGANIGDQVEATRHFPGQPAITGTWIITHIDRTFTREKGSVTATIEIQADLVPTYWWS